MTKVPVLPYPDQEVLLRGHLFIHHCCWTPSTVTLAELRECHDWDHDPQAFAPLPAPAMERPHTHAEPVIEEWSWE